jgi:hypothetical protein
MVEPTSESKLVGLAANRLQELRLAVAERPRAAAFQHFGVSDDRRERGPELVAHGGQEGGLELIELFQLVVGSLQGFVLFRELAVVLL